MGDEAFLFPLSPPLHTALLKSKRPDQRQYFAGRLPLSHLFFLLPSAAWPRSRSDPRPSARGKASHFVHRVAPSYLHSWLHSAASCAASGAHGLAPSRRARENSFIG